MRVKILVETVTGIGKGLIAQEDIKKGTLVYEHASARKQSFTSEESFREYLGGLPEKEKKQTVIHVFSHDGTVDVLDDDNKFINHSNDPNVDGSDYVTHNCVALRDIKKGEELTENYAFHGEVPWFDAISRELGVQTCTQFVSEFNSKALKGNSLKTS